MVIDYKNVFYLLSGRKYDKDGNLHSWWHNETAEKFNKLSHCFEDQYSSYEFLGEHLNGKLTLGECEKIHVVMELL